MVDEEPPSGQNLISQINNYYVDLLGYKPEHTVLLEVQKWQWENFTLQRGLNPYSSGIYLPRNQTAIIQQQDCLSLFHEYFGHGLFCEKSLSGRRLIDLEKKLLEEEKQEFQNRKFTLQEIKKFREETKTFQELEMFKKENLKLYELFAIWTEYLLSGELGLRDKFESKYDSLDKPDKDPFYQIVNFSKEFGTLSTFYNFGAAKWVTADRAKKILKEVYKDRLKNAKFALLYGSRKEFSDIDIFIVGEELPEIDCSWLDIRIERENDFESMIKLFDVSVVNAMINSDFICGDKSYFYEKVRQLKEQPIREEAIRYNLEKSEEQKRLAGEYPENSRKNIHGLTYSLTYLKNAIALKQNRRLLSKEELLSDSQSENIKMKGGGE